MIQLRRSTKVRFLLVLVCMSSVAPLQAEEFMQRYCFECHNQDVQEGRIRLDALDTDLGLLFRVYDQVLLEGMPPEEGEQPTAKERREFIQDLESRLADKGYDRKRQPGFGNYVDHQTLFAPTDRQAATEARIWRIDPSAFADIANKLIGKEVYRQQRQGVAKEHPSFSYATPAHTFKDFAAVNFFEETTTEMVLAYAKDIAAHMYENRFRPQLEREERVRLDKGNKNDKLLIASHDRIGETYQLLFHRKITEDERRDLADLDERSAVVALILRVESLFRQEVRMANHELARTLGFSLNESGPDSELFSEIGSRPLHDVLTDRMQTETFNRRLVRFLREYFEYDRAPDVFKDPEDHPPNVVTRQRQYRPEWYVEDADEFCLRIVRNDRQVLKELLTSNVYSVKGELNSLHIKEPKRADRNFYHYGYHGNYGIQEEQSGPWRRYWRVPNRLGMLHHPAWLISFSDNEKNQAIQRGRWITTKLLGGFVPDTPVEVDAKLPDDPSLTLREKMKVTRERKCWVCHQHMNEQGLPFEQFDFIGQYRQQEKGRPVVTSGSFKLPKDGQLKTYEINDPYTYVRTLAASRHVQQVFLRHVFRFFVGRNESLGDANTLIAMDRVYTKNNGSLKAAVRELLLSDSYRVRYPRAVAKQ